jgi:hypothetical protein
LKATCDLVLALSLALWTAEHRRAVYPRTRTTSVPRSRIPSIRAIDDPFHYSYHL